MPRRLLPFDYPLLRTADRTRANVREVLRQPAPPRAGTNQLVELEVELDLAHAPSARTAHGVQRHDAQLQVARERDGRIPYQREVFHVSSSRRANTPTRAAFSKPCTMIDSE